MRFLLSIPWSSSFMLLSEDRFNKKYKYPYVFLNEEPFSQEFKE